MADIQLGLCCMNTLLRARKPSVFASRSIVLKTFETKGVDYLKSKIIENLKDVLTMMEWNRQNGIHVFRLSSDLFPHKSNPKAPDYTFDFAKPLLSEIGELSKRYNQRLTFHPGQYNCIGTPSQEVFEHTLADLSYHADVLDLMELDRNSVIVVHGGGIYGDKASTKERWCEQFRLLPENVKRRLVIENCEKNFSIVDCLDISRATGVPVVFDTHHFECYKTLHPLEHLDPPRNYIDLVLQTWLARSIKPKFHVSEQGDGKCGHHSDYIESIPGYLLEIPKRYGVKIDIMIEAKMKEQAIFRLYRKYYRELSLPIFVKFLNCEAC
jgi:UV DNA damage endonuclease